MFNCLGGTGFLLCHLLDFEHCKIKKFFSVDDDYDDDDNDNNDNNITVDNIDENQDDHKDNHKDKTWYWCYYPKTFKDRVVSQMQDFLDIDSTDPPSVLYLV